MINEEHVEVSWDRVSKTTIMWLEEKPALSWRNFFEKLNPVFRMIVHICLHTAQREEALPGFAAVPRCLANISFFAVDYSVEVKNFLFSKYVDQCLRHSLPVVIQKGDRELKGSFNRIPVTSEERMAWSVVEHDFNSMRTELGNHTVAQFVLNPGSEINGKGVPWFLAADEIRFVRKPVDVPMGREHVLAVFELPFASLLQNPRARADASMEDRLLAVHRFFTDSAALSALSTAANKNLFRLMTLFQNLLRLEAGNVAQGGFPRFESFVEVGADLRIRGRCKNPKFDFSVSDLARLIVNWEVEPLGDPRLDSDESQNDILDDFESSGLFDDPY